MRQVIGIGALVLAVGFLPARPIWGQLPPGVQPGIQRTLDYHGTGRASFTALKIDQSARAAGMGDAYTAVADDINAIYWNSAGLTQVERFQYALGYTQWLVDSKFFSGAMAWHYGSQILGFSLIQFDAGTSQETTPLDPSGKFGRTIHAGDLFAKLVYARQMTNKLSLGVAVNLIQETLDQDHVRSLSFDFSSLFYTGFKSARLAMTLRNWGKDQGLLIPGSLPGNTQVAQPLIYTMALAMEVIGKRGDPYYLTIDTELAHHIDDRQRFQAGGEFWIDNTLALRAGYRWRYDLGKWTTGVGLQRDFGSGKKLGVDFAYQDAGALFSAPLRLSLTGSF